MMKQLIFFALIQFFSFGAFAQMDIPGDGGNLKASVSEDVGITNISIRYSRPAVKGREGKIWGGVVANGFNVFNISTGKPSSPWRAGANEATTIEFSTDDKSLPSFHVIFLHVCSCCILLLVS